MPNRVEREIEEILRGLDGSPSSGKPPIRLHPSRRERASRRVARGWRRLPSLRLPDPGTILLSGILLILSTLILRYFSNQLTYWAVIAGLVLLVAGFVLSFRRRGPGVIGSGDTYWRGERISRRELRGPSPADRLASWWRRRNRGR